jgi:hypothetical protein
VSPLRPAHHAARGQIQHQTEAQGEEQQHLQLPMMEPRREEPSSGASATQLTWPGPAVQERQVPARSPAPSPKPPVSALTQALQQASAATGGGRSPQPSPPPASDVRSRGAMQAGLAHPLSHIHLGSVSDSNLSSSSSSSPGNGISVGRREVAQAPSLAAAQAVQIVPPPRLHLGPHVSPFATPTASSTATPAGPVQVPGSGPAGSNHSRQPAGPAASGDIPVAQESGPDVPMAGLSRVPVQADLLEAVEEVGHHPYPHPAIATAIAHTHGQSSAAPPAPTTSFVPPAPVGATSSRGHSATGTQSSSPTGSATSRGGASSSGSRVAVGRRKTGGLTGRKESIKLGKGPV